MVRDYLLGNRQPPNDMMAWNEDQTRMPYRMHSEYLRKLFLNNDLAAGRYQVQRNRLQSATSRYPYLPSAPETDHVAPWKSVYKINLLANCQE